MRWGAFDLLWSEGTAYILGLHKALVLWRKLMKPASLLVLTDGFWLTDERSAEAIQFWSTDPDMLHVNDATALFSGSGLMVIHQFLQPTSDWMDDYYSPLEERSNTLLEHLDSAVRQAARGAQREIDIFRSHSDEYGHVGFVLERTDNSRRCPCCGVLHHEGDERRHAS